MKVENEIFYQIARGRNFKAGDKLHFGEELNGQMKIFNFTFYDDKNQPLHKAGFAEAKKFTKNRKTIKDMAIALSEYDFFMREIALEAVRKEKYPTLPSRFKCMYLSDVEEIARKNYENSLKDDPKQKIQLIKVRVTGDAFYIKDKSISREGLSFNEYKRRGEEFWEQKQDPSDKPHDAILFYGDVEIIEVLEDSNKQNEN